MGYSSRSVITSAARESFMTESSFCTCSRVTLESAKLRTYCPNGEFRKSSLSSFFGVSQGLISAEVRFDDVSTLQQALLKRQVLLDALLVLFGLSSPPPILFTSWKLSATVI